MTVLPPEIESGATELATRTPFSRQCFLDAAAVLWTHGFPEEQIVTQLDQICQSPALAPWTPLHAANALVQVLQLEAPVQHCTLDEALSGLGDGKQVR